MLGELLGRLRYRISNNTLAFPYQEDIENLMAELNIDCNGIGEKLIYIAQVIYIQYHHPDGWVLCSDPTDDEYDPATGQYIGYAMDRQKDADVVEQKENQNAK